MENTPPPHHKPVRTMHCEEILRTIPHRYPFLLVDRVEIIEENKSCVGIKCVTANELFFHGHFPQRPMMPGVLLIEGMAQTSAAMMMNLPGLEGHFALFAGIRSAKFRRQVIPGEVVKFYIEILRIKGKIGRVRGRALVEDELAAEAELTFAID